MAIIKLADFCRHEPWHAPEEPAWDRREEAIERRELEIWADADLLAYALDDASIPFDLAIATAIRDADRRLNKQPKSADSEADRLLRKICCALDQAVHKAAISDVDGGL